MKYYLQLPGYGSNLQVHQQINGKRNGTYIYSEIKFSKMHRNAEYYLQDSVGSQEDIMETELILHNF